jgi:hypothetical protein
MILAQCSRFLILLVLAIVPLLFGGGKIYAQTQARTIRGWLSDEACARSRATTGIYTNTNPECARKCVAEGKKIVLIAPDEKKVLTVVNQDMAKGNVGNEVEVSATIDTKNETVEIKSLKMLEEGRASCSAPRKKM